MLQLKNITKEYVVNSELTVQALKGVSVDFRTNEFVSILGPSGCGKTTLLNIIGGLDQYTSGDLVIDGVSTKTTRTATGIPTATIPSDSFSKPTTSFLTKRY